MGQVTKPLLAILLVVALVVGVVGGYVAASQLNNNQASPSAFLPYSDNKGGSIDDTQSGYVTSAPLVAGFSSGQIAWYWLMGPTNSSTNPVYFFQYQGGGTVQGQDPIIDVKPGDLGYTHFWELYNVTVSNNYTPNTIKSLATLKRAEQAGLATITDSKRAINGPLVARNVKITVVNGEPQFLKVWYRTQTANMAVFETNLPSGIVPSIPIWLIQRKSDSCPLLEALCNKDLNHDSDIKDSNDLIGTTPGQPGYFPLWAVSILHVHDNYLANGFPSPFPQNPASLKSQYGIFTSLDDAQADQNAANPVYVDLSVGSKGVTFTGNLVNCPALPLGVQPPAISFN
jgi:hypothetical protein